MWHKLSASAKKAAIDFSLMCLLFALNVYVCRELFRIEYTRHMGSIEAAFISLARYISQNWSDLTWLPLWYGGIPFQNSYPPLLHTMNAALTSLTALSPARSYHLVTATLYCLSPVTLYVLARRFCTSKTAAFFAGLFYTALSPSAFLVPQIRQDMGTVFGARRFETLVSYGEGPHLLGLVLLPLAVVALDVAVAGRRRWTLVPAAVAMAATVLSNWLAGFALAAAVLAYALARRDIVRTLGIAVVCGLLAYALALPWIPPSTIAVIETNSKTIGGDFTGIYRSLPVRALFLGSGLGIIVYVLRRTNASLGLGFAAMYSVLTAAIVLASAWLQIAVVPQPDRYHLEMELALCLLLALAAQRIAARMPRPARAAMIVVLLVAAVYPIKRERRFARYYLSPADISSTVEWKIGQWAARNLPHARILVPGTISYWLNTWTDTPQLGGGFDQGIANQQIRMVHYIVYSDDGAPGRELETSLLWLQAYGVDAVGAGGPGSQEVFKPYKHADKFRLLAELWREGDDAVWLVPSRSRSLARVVTGRDLPLRVPVNGIDYDSIRPYVSALNDASLPIADFRWTSRHHALVSAVLRPEHVLSLQITHHPGWHARVNGADRAIKKDGLGQMYLEPACHGPCNIEIDYDGGAEMTAARALQAGGVALCLLLVATTRLRLRRPS